MQDDRTPNQQMQEDVHQPNRPPFPPAHTYVSGYGFVSFDPMRREQRTLRRAARVSGCTVLLILLLSLILTPPIALLTRAILYVMTQFFASEMQLVTVNSALYELRELLVFSLALLIPMLIAAKSLGRIRKAPQSVRSSVTTLQLLPMALSVWVLHTVAADLLRKLCQQIGLIELSPNNSLPVGAMAFIFHILRMIVLPALLEEYLFRGVILHRLRRHGDSFALITSALLSGFIHYNLTDSVGGFLLGLVSGYTFLRVGTLRSSVTVHLGVATMPVLFRILQQVLPGQYRLIETELFVLVLLAGLLSFISLCRREPNALILHAKDVGLTVRERRRIFFANGWVIVGIAAWLLQMLQSFQLIR